MDSEASYRLSVAAFSLTAAATTKMVLDVAGFSATPISGHQYAKAGGERLDQTLDILNGPRGENIEDDILEQYLVTSDGLVAFRQNIEESTKSFMGSIIHRGEAKDFYIKADKLHGKALSSSHQANIKKNMKEIEKRKEAEQREAWERDSRELQARRRQMEEGVPQPTTSPLTHPNNHLNHVNVHVQHPSGQTPVYPPAASGAACHSSNSSRC